MRIVHVQSYFQPGLGYQEYYLMKKQAATGHEPIMITSDRYSPYPNYDKSIKPILGPRIVGIGEFIENDVRALRLPIMAEISAGLILIKGLIEAITSLNPDIILCHETFSPTAYVVAKNKNRIGVPIVFDNHASDFNTDFTRTFSRKVYRLLMRRFILPNVCNAADAFVAIGKGERIFLAREYGISQDRIELFWLGADTDRFYFDASARNVFRKELHLSSDDILVIYAGKLESQKDLDILAEATIIAMSANDKLRLLFVGGGEDEYVNNLKKLVEQSVYKEKISFRGMVNPDVLRGLYSAADIGVWPGNYSNTILEAMACKLAVVVPHVVSAFSDNSHLTVNGASRGFTRRNKMELAAIIGELAENAAFRKVTAQKGYELIMQHYNWDSISRQFLDLFEKILHQ